MINKKLLFFIFLISGQTSFTGLNVEPSKPTIPERYKKHDVAPAWQDGYEAGVDEGFRGAERNPSETLDLFPQFKANGEVEHAWREGYEAGFTYGQNKKLWRDQRPERERLDQLRQETEQRLGQ